MASVISKAMLVAMKATLPLVNRMGAVDVEVQRKSQDALDHIIKPSKNTTYQELEIEGMPAAWVKPAQNVAPGRVVLHFHGGAYVSGSLKYSRILASMLAERMQMDVLTFDYRLAPENPFPAALYDAVKAYKWLLSQGYPSQNIALAGESAGGNLCLAVSLWLRDRGESLPGAIYCMSPWADLTGGGATYYANAKIDPMVSPESLLVSAKYYTGHRNPKAPYLSPIFADFSGFPPVLVQAGTNEVLLSDSHTLADRVRWSGVTCQLQIYEGMCHVFQILGLPESKQALAAAEEFIKNAMNIL